MDHKELLVLYRSMKKITNLALQLKCVKKENFIDMESVWIADANGNYDIEIGKGSIIAPNVYFFGKIVIGKDTIIGIRKGKNNKTAKDNPGEQGGI